MPRKPTHADAELLLRLYEIRREPELRRARQWFLRDFQAASWDDIQGRYLTHTDEDRWFRMTISYWEMVATMVVRGVLHDALFYDHTGEDVVAWEKCKSWIGGARASIRPSYLRNWEKLVANHLAYRVKLHASLARATSPRKGRRKPR